MLFCLLLFSSFTALRGMGGSWAARVGLISGAVHLLSCCPERTCLGSLLPPRAAFGSALSKGASRHHALPLCFSIALRASYLGITYPSVEWAYENISTTRARIWLSRTTVSPAPGIVATYCRSSVIICGMNEWMCFKDGLLKNGEKIVEKCQMPWRI